MTTAQPGQEQRMECKCPERDKDMIWYGVHACRDGERIAPENLYLTRPTADLGEDGKLLRKLRRTSVETVFDDLENSGRRETRSLLVNPDGREAADRLILYREALVAARPYVEANASRDSRMTAHHKGADVLDMIDAVLSRSGG